MSPLVGSAAARRWYQSIGVGSICILVVNADGLQLKTFIQHQKDVSLYATEVNYWKACYHLHISVWRTHLQTKCCWWWPVGQCVNSCKMSWSNQAYTNSCLFCVCLQSEMRFYKTCAGVGWWPKVHPKHALLRFENIGLTRFMSWGQIVTGACVCVCQKTRLVQGENNKINGNSVRQFIRLVPNGWQANWK